MTNLTIRSASYWLFQRILLGIGLAVISLIALFPLHVVLTHVYEFIGVRYAHAEQLDDGPLTFALNLPDVKIDIPFPQTGKDVMLARACMKHAPDDAKCFCVNKAIFVHDSGFATAGVGKKTNNPSNMRIPRTWTPSVPFTVYHSPGNGTFAKFATLEDGISAGVETYARFYKDSHPSALVSAWTDGGGDRHYRGAVNNCYS